ncbi:hypothetical protein DOE73_23125 [Paenibacillus dendritiformis]|nr:hypothetical protein DOE73_23125 [Paenibacillus dendritiformis]
MGERAKRPPKRIPERMGERSKELSKSYLNSSGVTPKQQIFNRRFRGDMRIYEGGLVVYSDRRAVDGFDGCGIFRFPGLWKQGACRRPGGRGACGTGKPRTEDANLAWLLARAPFVVK